MKLKNLQFIFCGIIAILFACSAQQNEFVLTGKIKNNPAGYLLVGDGKKKISNADTIRLAADGTFTYTYRCEEPSIGFIFVPDKAFYNLILINGCKSQLMADADLPFESHWEGDLKEAHALKKTVDISLASKSEAHYASFAEMRRVYTDFADSVKTAVAAIQEKEFHSLQTESLKRDIDYYFLNYHEQLASAQKPAGSDADYNRYMEGLDMNVENNLQVYLLWKEACAGREKEPSYLAMLQLAKQKATKPEALEALTMNLMIDYFSNVDKNLEEIYKTAMPLLKDKKEQGYLTELYNTHKKLVPGASPIDCVLTSPEGKTLKLSDLYGKVIYLDIWATWCGPCCEEIPFIEKLAEHFKDDKRMQFVSISVDANKKAWLDKLAKDKPQWQQYLYPNFTKDYGITGIPCFIMIDKSGKLITTNAPRPSDEKCIEFIKQHLP